MKFEHMYMATKIYKLIPVFISITSFLLNGCKKQIEVDAPYTSTNAGNVFNDDATAKSALTGIYAQMGNSSTFSGSRSIGLYAGLSADELTLYSGVTDSKLIAYYTNSLASNGSLDYGTDAWKSLYPYLYTCNAAIYGLTASNSLTPSVRQQLLGEAKFLRAFFNFYLVNLYGDIALQLTTDYKVNALLSRSPKSQVYQQIEKDLNDAHDLLSIDYLDGNMNKYSASFERLRPTKWAAAALLARAYLYDGNNNYVNSESLATEVINNVTVYSLDSLNGVFLKNDKEAIWQLQPVNSGRNTEDATTFILTSTGPTTTADRPVYLSDTLLKSFEPNDQRKIKWINSVTSGGVKYYYPFKYKNNGTSVTEYLMVLRLGEQFLIRAEARALLDNTSGALSDLNVIRNRAGLPNYLGATDKNSMLAAIRHERQVELFTEWGHRWMDLIRTSNVDAVMSGIISIKTGGVVQWNTYRQLYPIPFSDIQNDIHLIQNDGY
jgi:hypothetical protein